MSRSYKHFPYCNYRSTKVKKEIRRHYNHRLRQTLKNLEITCKGNEYKKWSRDDWDLFCGSYQTLKDYKVLRIWIDKDEYDEKETINFWKKWYYRK